MDGVFSRNSEEDVVIGHDIDHVGVSRENLKMHRRHSTFGEMMKLKSKI